MLKLSHKKDAVKQLFKIYCLYVEDYEIWNYCDIKVYLKTLMLGKINHD